MIVCQKEEKIVFRQRFDNKWPALVVVQAIPKYTVVCVYHNYLLFCPCLMEARCILGY